MMPKLTAGTLDGLRSPSTLAVGSSQAAVAGCEQSFYDYLVDFGAKALARMAGLDPDELEHLHDGKDLRKKFTLGEPHFMKFRAQSKCVIDATFAAGRNRTTSSPR
jgi:hypothetical protein